MDPSTFVSILVGVLLPFLSATIKNPASIVKLAKSLPILKVISNSLIQLIAVIESKVTPTAAGRKLAADNLDLLKGSVITLSKYDYEIS